MKLTTKTIGSLLATATSVLTMPALAIARREDQLAKLLNRHDRKGEIRAELLGMSPQEFKQLSRKKSFSEIISNAGFKSTQAFLTALSGYLRTELRQRGWTAAKIDSYVFMRSSRLAYA